MPSVIQRRRAPKQPPSTHLLNVAAQTNTAKAKLDSAVQPTIMSAADLETLARIVMPDSLAQTVDAMGKLKAKISKLEEEEKRLKDILVGSGQTEIKGDLFRATVSTADRETLIAEKVREFLSPQQLRAATKTTEVTTVRVAAHKKA